jgi:hypothetical protein
MSLSDGGGRFGIKRVNVFSSSTPTTKEEQRDANEDQEGNA